MMDIIPPPKPAPITGLDRYEMSYHKNWLYLRHSWAGMSSPGPYRTIWQDLCPGWTLGLDGV